MCIAECTCCTGLDLYVSKTSFIFYTYLQFDIFIQSALCTPTGPSSNANQLGPQTMTADADKTHQETDTAMFTSNKTQTHQPEADKAKHKHTQTKLSN